MDPLLLSATGEPYIRLSSPFQNIIITPPRLSDVTPSVAIMNEPTVYAWMGRSTPYTASNAEQWIVKVKAETDAVIEDLKANPSGPFGGCPVRHIREVQEDGTEIFIGDVGLVRSYWPELLDVDERKALAEKNKARAPGDPEIAWHVGYYLASSHHGRGLMTAAVGALINQWGIPKMGARRIRSSAFVGNHGSVKVLEKNGFVLVETLHDHVKVGEGHKSLHLFEWSWKSGRAGSQEY